MILVRSFRGKDKGSCSEIRNRKRNMEDYQMEEKIYTSEEFRKLIVELQENEILEVTFVGEE